MLKWSLDKHRFPRRDVARFHIGLAVQHELLSWVSVRSRVPVRTQLQGQCDWLVVACCGQAVSAIVQQKQHQWLHGAWCDNYAISFYWFIYLNTHTKRNITQSTTENLSIITQNALQLLSRIFSFFFGWFAAFVNVFTNLSTSPLALGQSGVTFPCSKPITRANFANASPLNGRPLSDLTTRGSPNVENSCSNLGVFYQLHWSHKDESTSRRRYHWFNEPESRVVMTH